MYRMGPYLLLAGLLCLTVDGVWIANHYETLAAYPEEAYLFMIGGTVSALAGFLLTESGKRYGSRPQEEVPGGEGKGLMHIINMAWKHRERYAGYGIIAAAAVLGLLAVYDLHLALSLLMPVLTFGLTIYVFVFIMQDEDRFEDTEQEDIYRKGLLRLADWRKQPFCSAFLIFSLAAWSLLLSKEAGVSLAIEMSGNPRYHFSWESGLHLLTPAVFGGGFFYLIHNTSFAGVKQTAQADNKLTAFHFAELGCSGLVCAVWIFRLFTALL